MVGQQGAEHLRPRPWWLASNYFYVLRLVAALASVVTTGVVVSIGWQLAGPIAGWFAGLVWALAPDIVTNGNLALPDPFVFLTCAAAITCAIRAWKVRSLTWATLSLLFGILAVYLKYAAI